MHTPTTLTPLVDEGAYSRLRRARPLCSRPLFLLPVSVLLVVSGTAGYFLSTHTHRATARTAHVATKALVSLVYRVDDAFDDTFDDDAAAHVGDAGISTIGPPPSTDDVTKTELAAGVAAAATGRGQVWNSRTARNATRSVATDVDDADPADVDPSTARNTPAAKRRLASAAAS